MGRINYPRCHPYSSKSSSKHTNICRLSNASNVEAYCNFRFALESPFILQPIRQSHRLPFSVISPGSITTLSHRFIRLVYTNFFGLSIGCNIFFDIFFINFRYASLLLFCRADFREIFCRLEFTLDFIAGFLCQQRHRNYEYTGNNECRHKLVYTEDAAQRFEHEFPYEY